MSRCIYSAVLSLSRPSFRSPVKRVYSAKCEKDFKWMFAKPSRTSVKKQPRGLRIPKQETPVSSQEVVFSPWDHSQNGSRHELQSKLEALESLGCTKDQIQESPEILLYSERDILRRVERLRKCGIREINVMTLKLGSMLSNKVLMKKAEELQNMTVGKETIGEVLREKLQLSAAEWHNAMHNHIYLRRIRNLPKFISKVDYLLSLGYTIEDVKRHLGGLNKSLRYLQTSVKNVKDSDPSIGTSIALSSLYGRRKYCKRRLDDEQKEREAMHALNNKFETMADLLGASVDEVKSINILHAYTLNRFLSIVPMLLAQGVSQDDILSHTYVLTRAPSLLQKGLDEMKELGFAKPSLLQLGNMLLRHKITKRQVRQKELSMLAALLDCHVGILEPYRLELKHIALKEKRELKPVVEYLESQGFIAKDIARCPLLIGHDLSILRSYVDTYRDRKEYGELEKKFQGDSIKLLNWIQYLIERDINFTSQEAIVDEDGADV